MGVKLDNKPNNALNQISDKEFQQLVIEYQKIGNKVTSRFKISNEDRDDCYFLALLKAHKNYIPGRAKFSTYLYKIIFYECLNRYKENLFNDDEDIPIMVNTNIMKYMVAQPKSTDEIYLDITNSTIPDKELLIDRFLYKRTLKEIGQKYDFSHETARERLFTAIEKLEDYLDMQ